MDKSDLFREAIQIFVRVQAAKRLAALGGKTPTMQAELACGTPPAPRSRTLGDI